MCLPSLPRCELKDASVSRDPMPVIPANAGRNAKRSNRTSIALAQLQATHRHTGEGSTAQRASLPPAWD